MSITLLDGGLGQELVRRGDAGATPLWSTQVMMDQPDLVGDLHRDFYAAGAEIATTNTYSAFRDRLVTVGLEDQFEALANAAVAQAEAARADFPGRRIAGSIGPLRGSYVPETCPPAAQAAEEYADSVALMKDRVDLFVLETMSSVDQVDGALRAACGHGLPVWLGVTVDDTNGLILRSGESLEALADVLDRHNPDAILLNCSRPEAVSAGLPIIAEFGRPFGAYANGFTIINAAFKSHMPTADVLETRTDLGPLAYADFAQAWVDMGATIIGGCCEVGPAHIAELKRRFSS